MTRNYSASKHLYTLNESPLSPSPSHSSSSCDSRSSQTHHHLPAPNPNKLAKKNEELQRAMTELQLKNQQLYEVNELAQRRNQKHEEKQRDLIRKLSYLQVNNQQLTAELQKMTNQFKTQSQHQQQAGHQGAEVRQAIKRAISEKDRFLTALRQIVDTLRLASHPQHYTAQRQQVLQLIDRNISSAEHSSHPLHYQLDYQFEVARADTLREQVSTLEAQLANAQKALEQEKADKKRLLNTYNEKVGQLRALHQTLRERVEQQEQVNQRQMRQALAQKDEVIQGLTQQLQQSRVRRPSGEGRKSRDGSKSFIGDGDYSRMELGELNQAIQNLEMQIIKEFEE